MKGKYTDKVQQERSAAEPPLASLPHPATLPHPGLVIGPLMDAVAAILHAKNGIAILLQLTPTSDGTLPDKDRANNAFWLMAEEFANHIAAKGGTDHVRHVIDIAERLKTEE